MKTSLFRCSLGLIVTLLFLPQVVFSSGVVNTATDAALRAALSGGGTVTFNCEGTITLTGAMAIASSTVINASGHTITLSGGNAVQLFSVNAGVTASFINLTLANGYAAGSNGVAGPPVTDGQPGTGGAVLNNGGTVALSSCTVVSNLAVGGAGYANCIYPTNSNGGAGLGGAIYNLAGNVFVTNCSFSANVTSGGTGGHNMGYGGAGGAACGSAIYSSGGSITVQNSTFLSHTAQGGMPGQGSAVYYGSGGSAWGGVIYSTTATVNFNNSIFTNNSATGVGGGYAGSGGWGYGGAISAQGGTVNCAGCIFATNTAAGGGAFKTYAGSASGGAICSYASLSVSQSSFFGNHASGNSGGWGVGEGDGGAIYNGNSLSLSGNIFAQNTVLGGNGMSLLAGGNTPGGIGRGGAVCSQGTLTATNCTFTANSAKGGTPGNGISSAPGTGGDGRGGGLFNSGTATLVNLTFATNNAIGGAGGRDITGAYPPGPDGLSLGGAICNSNGTVNLYNTIVASSTSGSNCFGALADLGYNLSSDASAGFYAPGSLNNTDPLLGPLGNYGGPTLTLPLLAGSPAIDGGNTATAPATDQRGHARPYGAAADIGAFESSPPYFIGGQVSGHTFRDEVTMVIGSSNLVTTNLGSYGVSAFAAGAYTVTPASPNYLFIPANRPLTVGPDQFGVNFNTYHWNAVSLEAVTNGMMYCIVADTNGQPCRVLTSTDLVQWLPASTNTAGSSNYFEAFLPITGEPVRYYRTAIP
jgi:fibronectin-binding autotransporter adhesin